MGWHASDTALITFDDVFVPEENLLGAENQGFYLIMANFQWERLLMALGAVGGMQVAFEKTLKYAAEQLDDSGGAVDSECERASGRRAGGWPEGSHQAIRHKLAEVALRIEAGRDVTYAALRRYVAGEDAVREVTIAKLATQRTCFEVIDDCLQIHGGSWLPGRVRARACRARCPARSDRRRHRRDHARDSRSLTGPLTRSDRHHGAPVPLYSAHIRARWSGQTGRV